MSEWLEIELPYPPSVNHYWRHTRNGRHYISEKGRAYKAEVSRICRQFDSFKGAVKVQLLVYYPDQRKRDPDNLHKALWDAVTASGLIEEDHNHILVDVRTITAGFKKGGMVVLRIKEDHGWLEKIKRWFGLDK